MIEVRPLTASDHADYERLLREQDATLIYPSLEYRDFLSRVVPGESHYLLAFDGVRIEGVLPYFRMAVAGEGAVINSLPWYGSHGGCTLADPLRLDVREALLRRYVQEVSAPGVLSATMILTPNEEPWQAQYREILQPCAQDRRIGQVSTLPDDGPDVSGRLERMFTPKTRNVVRKALKQGVTPVVTEDEWAWRFLCETHQENLRALNGRAKPWEHFLAMRHAFPEPMRRLWVAVLDREPVAALLLLYFHRTVEYWVPAIRQEARPRQPLSCLIVHAMEDAVRRGYRWWNWGGTWATQSSLHHFKAGWGAVDRPYAYLVNSTPDGMVFLRRHQATVAGWFPYYYTHPYEATR